MVFTQLAKRAVRPVRGDREDVADLGLAVGDDDAVDEQFGPAGAKLKGVDVRCRGAHPAAPR
jgi:hypothetical protein